MLRFAQKLNTLNNKYLKDFSQYLNDGYHGDRYVDNPNCKDKRMEELHDFIVHIYLLPKMSQSIQCNGCALLGETPFDKLDFTRAFLENYRGSEYVNDGITKNRYVIVDCEGKAKKSESILRYAVKYKDVPFVIFNNCENILKNGDVLTLFKGLCDGNRNLSYLGIRSESKDAVFKSWYILLGKEDKRYKILEKAPTNSSMQYNIERFGYFIRICDFDKGHIYTEELLKYLQEAGIKFDEKGKQK